MSEIIKPEHKILRPDILPEQPIKPEAEAAPKSVEKMEVGEPAANSTAKQSPAAPVSRPAISALTPFEKKVESVLEEDMTDIFLSLPPDKQEEFKKAGEIAAKKISRLMQKVKINLRQVIKIIRQWLSVIPGVNKYFLEQTAKIKADKILKLH
ncbi:MAG: hypothetical protein ACOZAJ_04355 [Patescibacteria group bacterium]